MKSTKKNIQALVVVIVVGIGWINNLDKNSIIYQHFSPRIAGFESNDSKTDSLKVKESNIYSFTKDIIDSGIQHLISNL